MDYEGQRRKKTPKELTVAGLEDRMARGEGTAAEEVPESILFTLTGVLATHRTSAYSCTATGWAIVSYCNHRC